MELNSLFLSEMFEELKDDESMAITGQGGSRSGIVASVIVGGGIIALGILFLCVNCNIFFDAADDIGYDGDPNNCTCPNCGDPLEPIYEDILSGC